MLPPLNTLTNIIVLWRDFLYMHYAIMRIALAKKPIVTVFGGAQAPHNGTLYHQAELLGALLATKDILVLTGGGPGIMEGAHCGACIIKKCKRAIAIQIEGVDQDKINKCLHTIYKVHYFFVRKYILMSQSSLFIVFPGGYGTLDELMEIIVQMQTNKLKKSTIIIFDKTYWDGLFEWIATKTTLMDPSVLSLIVFINQIDQIIPYLESLEDQ